MLVVFGPFFLVSRRFKQRPSFWCFCWKFTILQKIRKENWLDFCPTQSASSYPSREGLLRGYNYIQLLGGDGPRDSGPNDGWTGGTNWRRPLKTERPKHSLRFDRFDRVRESYRNDQMKQSRRSKVLAYTSQ